jgi:transcriptional regulator with XRE-family HTH domain
VRPSFSRHALGVIPLQSQTEIELSSYKISSRNRTDFLDRGLILSMRKLEKKINTRILSELKKREMSQTELARIADIPQGYLNELLNLKKEKRWNIETLEKVSEALNIPAWSFLAAPEDVLPPEYLRWVEAYNSLDEFGKRNIENEMLAAKHRQEDERKKKQDRLNYAYQWATTILNRVQCQLSQRQ